MPLIKGSSPDTELAYIAGFFDGEGCVNFARCGKGYFIRVLIVNTDIEILRHIQHIFGGDINNLALRKDGWKQGRSLRIGWSKAIEFLDAIYPWLRVKAPQAEVAFAWNAIRIGSGRKPSSDTQGAVTLLREQLHFLNAKGAETDWSHSPASKLAEACYAVN